MEVTRGGWLALVTGALLVVALVLWLRVSLAWLLLVPLGALVADELLVTVLRGDSLIRRAFNAIARRFGR